MNHRTDAWRTVLRVAACALAVAACCGCSTFGPRPWEKDLMAKKQMQVDAYALEAAAMDHIYFSKEASSGGRGFAGGGCGCN
jgi:Domain of unknown function (DUF4266)